MPLTNTPILNAEVVLKQGDGEDPEDFATVVGGRDITVSLGADPVETTSADDVDPNGVYYRTYRSGPINFSATGNFVIKTASVFNQMIADFQQGTARNYQVLVTGKGTFEGPLRVTSFEFGGGFSEEATYRMTFNAAGAVPYTPETA